MSRNSRTYGNPAASDMNTSSRSVLYAVGSILYDYFIFSTFRLLKLSIVSSFFSLLRSSTIFRASALIYSILLNLASLSYFSGSGSYCVCFAWEANFSEFTVCLWPVKNLCTERELRRKSYTEMVPILLAPTAMVCPSAQKATD